MNSHNQRSFFELLKVGLFPAQRAGLMVNDCSDVDWGEVYRLAEEQSVVGQVAAGIDWFKSHDSRFKVPQEWALRFIGATLQFEHQYNEMNQYLASLIQYLRNNEVCALLVKGQGLAQCYEKPLWRACGDIDLFLSAENYEKAKELLLPKATKIEMEGKYSKHLGMTIDGWVVELHGTLRSSLSYKVVKGLDDIYRDTFYNGYVRSWNNQGVQTFMLGVENDVVFVFTHFLRHFYKGGVGLRQICDWCRLIWTYRNEIDVKKVEEQIKRMGLMSEWNAFGALTVDYLGMPATAMPFYVKSSKWSRKAEQIVDFLLMSGNFGHNRDMSYMNKYPYVIRKTISLGRRIGDMFRHARIFPVDSFRFFFYIMWNGVVSAMRGE